MERIEEFVLGLMPEQQEQLDAVLAVHGEEKAQKLIRHWWRQKERHQAEREALKAERQGPATLSASAIAEPEMEPEIIDAEIVPESEPKATKAESEPKPEDPITDWQKRRIEVAPGQYLDPADFAPVSGSSTAIMGIPRGTTYRQPGSRIDDLIDGIASGQVKREHRRINEID